MISLMLVAKATGRQVHVHTCRVYSHVYTNHSREYMHTHLYIYFTLQAMTLLNHAGVCMSYTATMEPFAMQVWCRSLKRMLGL